MSRDTSTSGISSNGDSAPGLLEPEHAHLELVHSNCAQALRLVVKGELDFGIS